jgi:hypothetical protein
VAPRRGEGGIGRRRGRRAAEVLRRGEHELCAAAFEGGRHDGNDDDVGQAAGEGRALSACWAGGGRGVQSSSLSSAPCASTEQGVPQPPFFTGASCMLFASSCGRFWARRAKRARDDAHLSVCRSTRCSSATSESTPMITDCAAVPGSGRTPHDKAYAHYMRAPKTPKGGRRNPHPSSQSTAGFEPKFARANFCREKSDAELDRPGRLRDRCAHSRIQRYDVVLSGRGGRTPLRRYGRRQCAIVNRARVVHSRAIRGEVSELTAEGAPPSVLRYTAFPVCEPCRCGGGARARAFLTEMEYCKCVVCVLCWSLRVVSELKRSSGRLRSPARSSAAQPAPLLAPAGICACNGPLPAAKAAAAGRGASGTRTITRDESRARESQFPLPE